ncbi:unnamed protein product [Orchesella dallaii]|uniref:Uncharacterized protein n=1 Tax=Orchesella dallaii TaxID=48710 RepID=A0ABP1RAY9_9HEXA
MSSKPRLSEELVSLFKSYRNGNSSLSLTGFHHLVLLIHWCMIRFPNDISLLRVESEMPLLLNNLEEMITTLENGNRLVLLNYRTLFGYPLQLKVVEKVKDKQVFVQQEGGGRNLFKSLLINIATCVKNPKGKTADKVYCSRTIEMLASFVKQKMIKIPIFYGLEPEDDGIFDYAEETCPSL